MIAEQTIAELGILIAELRDKVRRLQNENRDLLNQLGADETRINNLLIDNQRLKAYLAKPYKDENTHILGDKEALEELKRRMEEDLDGATCVFHGVDTMTEPSPYEGTNSTDGVDTCPGQCAEESVVDTHPGHIANKFPQCVAYTSEVVPSINPNATTAD